MSPRPPAASRKTARAAAKRQKQSFAPQKSAPNAARFLLLIMPKKLS